MTLSILQGCEVPRGVMANEQDCHFEISEFEIQLRNSAVHCRKILLGKAWTLTSLQLQVK